MNSYYCKIIESECNLDDLLYDLLYEDSQARIPTIKYDIEDFLLKGPLDKFADYDPKKAKKFFSTSEIQNNYGWRNFEEQKITNGKSVFIRPKIALACPRGSLVKTTSF